MNTHKNFNLIALFLLAGILGGVIGASIIKSYTPNTRTTSGTTITQPEIVKEKIASSAVTEVVKKASPSVVSIVVTKEFVKYKSNPRDFFMNDPFFNDFFGDDSFGSPYQMPNQKETPKVEKQKQQVAGGTGFIVSEDGKVVTNKHVVSIPDAEYTVLLNDGTEYKATIISRDPTNDLALLQIQAKDEKTPLHLPPLPLAESKNVQVGQFVVAIGNALGEFRNTVTMGVISAENRKIVANDNSPSGESLTNLLQTDAAINPGNSGGPLLSLDGEVLGVNTAIAAGANGIGFAIPVSEVHSILKSVASYGKIVRPFLGIMYKANSPEVAKIFNLKVDYGAIVQEGTGEEIVKDSPAKKAGVIPGDIILSINDRKIDEKNELKDIISSFNAGETVELKIMRGNEEIKKSITLGKREDQSTDTKAQASSSTNAKVYIGIHTVEITKDIRDMYRLPVDSGILIIHNFQENTPAVEKNSPGEKAGLANLDIITKAESQSTTTQESLKQILSGKKPGDKIKLEILRNGKSMTVEVTLEETPK